MNTRKTGSLRSVRRRPFTLIELLVAMGVFAVLMLALVGFFDSAQKVWVDSSRKTEIYENARIAMDLITRDLQATYYEYATIPFYYPDTGRIGFVSYSSLTDSPHKSRLAEVQYKLGTKSSSVLGCDVDWLQVSLVGDKFLNYNFYKNFTSAAFSVPANGDGAFENVVPYITGIDFKCFRKEGNALLPIATNNAVTVEFPYLIRFELKMLDRDSWRKWKQTGADAIRDENERTFSKTVILGDRGQYQ